MFLKLFKNSNSTQDVAGSVRPFHVLIVDDDHEILQLYSEFLEEGGHIPTVVSNADQAVQLVRTVPFDILLLDVYLGTSNGIELVKLLRNFGFSQPVILCSGFLERYDAVGQGLNIVDFLQKPLSPEDLVRSLERVQRSLSLRNA